MDEIEIKLENIRGEYGPWTAHNIKLPSEHYTIGSSKPLTDSLRGDYFVEVTSCILQSDLKGLRVLDLGCLEGAITLQFAKAGALVDGIDIRSASIAKANCVREILNLDNVRFIVGDALDLESNTLLHTKYEVILCAGLLYHIDAPDQLPFLRKLASLCSGITIIDSHYSIDASDEYKTEEGLLLRGKFISEDPPNFSLGRRNAMWASWKNEKSFWLSESSLQNAMYLAGFSLVARIGQPHFAWPWIDRGTWVGYPRIESQPFRYKAPFVDEQDECKSVHPTILAGYNCKKNG